MATVGAGSMLATVPTNAVPAGAAAPNGAPIAIGDLCSCTGFQASSVAQTTPTAQAWASWVNAHGGLNGHPVKLYVADDQTNPATATTLIQGFLQTDHVAAIFDNSQEDTSWVAAAASAGVPVIGGMNSNVGFENPDVFPTGATVNYGIAGQDLGLVKRGIKSEALLYCVEAAVCASETHIAAKIGARFGIKVPYTSGISFSAPNYSAQCLAAKQAGVKSLQIGDAVTVVEKVGQDCAAQGFHPVQVTGSSIVAISMATDPNFDGMIATQQDIPYIVHNGATKDFYAALHKYQPTLLSSPNFGEGAIQQWSYGVLLQDAATAAAPGQGATVTGAVMKKGLYHLPAGDNLGGIAPQTINFTKGVPANFECWFYMSAKNGKSTWANGQKPACAPLMKPGTPEGGPLLKN
jgi:branched-chain amino acid transport system substrate-binding protein